MGIDSILNKLNDKFSKVKKAQRDQVMSQAPASMADFLNVNKVLTQQGLPTNRINMKPEKINTPDGTKYVVRYMTNTPNKSVEWALTSTKPTFVTISSFIIYDTKLVPRLELHTIPKFPPQQMIKMMKMLLTKLPGVPILGTFQEGEMSREELTGWVSLVTMVLSGLVMIFSLGYVLYTKVTAYRAEHGAANKVEKEINQKLFGAQTGQEPAFNVYSKVINVINDLLKPNSKSNGCIIYGPPGMSKTYIVRRTLYFNKIPASKYIIAKGAALSVMAVYQFLYNNRNRLIIFDDFDKPLVDEEIINLLKSALDSYPKRILSLVQETSARSGELSSRTPNRFVFTGKIIILTNKSKDDINTALMSRVPTIELNFNSKEVIKIVGQMLTYIAPNVDMKIKQEVYRFIRDQVAKHPAIVLDFRKFSACIDARVGNPKEWKSICMSIITS